MRRGTFSLLVMTVLLLLVTALPAMADVNVQCPGDTDGDAQWTGAEVQPPNTACRHIAGADGFTVMADGSTMYIFSFIDATGTLPDQVMNAAQLGAQSPAPLITAQEGDDFYLTLTVRAMVMRPDLFDPHSIHWHGFPNAASVFDGEPMASFTPVQGSSFTYYYKVPGPGTYMYHCHVEASEHMQMGMLGNLYVTPLQDGTTVGGCTSQTYVYNDGDGTTCYDVGYPFQIISFDPNFHNSNLTIQPLNFAGMLDTYPLINGRGYPDTINPSTALGAVPENNNSPSQRMPSLITATQGQKILLRVSSLATVRFYTVTSPSIPMKVVGRDAKILRNSAGTTNLYYTANSITLGGGESADVILDTQNIAAGTYFIYAANLEELNNNQQDFGGMMTEIVIQ